MAEEHSAKEAKFVALQEKKAEEAKELIAEAKEEKAAELEEEKKNEAKSAPDKKGETTTSKEGEKKKGEPKKEGKITDSKPGEKGKAPEKKEEKKEEPKKEEKKREIVLERIYTVPLWEIYSKPQQSRGNMAITFLRKFLARHMKGAPEKIKISLILNNTIRKRGSGRPMKKVKIKATKDKEGLVLAELAA